MQKLYKQSKAKGGFTLTELMLVVAIILILAVVVGFGAQKLIQTARGADEAVAGSSNELSSQIDASEAMLAAYSFGE